MLGTGSAKELIEPMNGQPLKCCTSCGLARPLSAFVKKAASKDGRASLCIPCQREYNARWREAHPETVIKNNERWRKKNPRYAQEWQSKNMDRHVKANQAYRDRNILRDRGESAGEKTCNSCAETKPLSEFWVTTGFKDGRANRCVKCSMERKRLHFYGLSEVKFSEMWTAQGGLCGICGDEMKQHGKGGCVVDHDHQTGKLRALLCSPCNLALGHLQDNPTRAEKAADYLRQHQRAMS